MQFGATADRDAQIAYCREHMLPIWEYWTDGNPAFRQLLACENADPALFDGRYQSLIAATYQLRKGSRNAQVAAALAAAHVVCSASVGVSARQFQRMCYQAEEAGRLASRVASRW
jgi:hypothetical protein